MAVDQLSPYQEIPDKPYFKIEEVAELAGVPSYVLRFWESEFSSIRPKRADSGQRLYRKNDVETILTIKHLLHEKRFTIEGAKQHLRHERQVDTVGYISKIDSYVGHGPEALAVPASDATDPDRTELLKEVCVELRHIQDLLDKL